MVETKSDYSEILIEAARNVLLEVAHLLSGYRDGIVLVGGWAPDLLLTGEQSPHIGSRLKEKDGYDVYYAITHYPGGPEALAQAFTPYRRNRLVRESLAIIAENLRRRITSALGWWRILKK